MSIDYRALEEYVSVRSLCEYGVRQIKSGKYDIICFYTFNDLEHEEIEREMARIAPDVKYFFSPLFKVKP